MNPDPVRWLKDEAKKAQETRDSRQLIAVYKKMLTVAHGRARVLAEAHQGLAEAYACLGDPGRAKKHRRECQAALLQEARAGDTVTGTEPDGTGSPYGIPWIGEEERWFDYEDYLKKKPAALLAFTQWKALDDELLLLLAWSNLRELKAVEAARLAYLEALLLVA